MPLESQLRRPASAAVRPLYLGWPTGVRIRDIFAAQAERAGIRGPGGATPACLAANDINLAALAEHRHGAFFAVVTLTLLGLNLCGLAPTPYPGLMIAAFLTLLTGYAFRMGQVLLRQR